MKKLYVLLPILMANLLCAKKNELVPATRVNKNVDIQKELDNAKVIRFSITIYRNETQYDQDAWKETVQKTADLIELASREGTDVEFVDGVVNSIRHMHKRSNINDGIHGEIKVGLGAGECECGSGCDCAEKYKGLCPCSALEGSDCKGEQVRCPGHPA